MQLKTLLTLSGAGLFFLLIIGCAKTNVHETFSVANTGISKPNQVLIYIFAISPEDHIKTFRASILPTSHPDFDAGIEMMKNIKVSDPTAKEIQLQLDHREREVSDAMATELEKKIAVLGLNPIRADQNSQMTSESIMVTINLNILDDLNESGKSRNGQITLESKVSVLASLPSGNRELLALDIHSDRSNTARAWAVGLMGPISAGEAAVIATNVAASTQQAKKMAEEIAAQLATYFAKQGWVKR